MHRFARVVAGLVGVGAVLMAAGCSSTSTPAASPTAGSGGTVAVVAGENEYGNVASQIGGKYVSVYSVDSNPNTDPHTYEATPSVGQKIANANLLIENGVGYDTFMDSLASASPNSARKVINVQQLLGLPDSTPNPHLWYSPATMPAVAEAIARDLSALDPSRAPYFRHNLTEFDRSLIPWLRAIARFKASYPHAPVATTEPVADYMLEAAGTDNLTPFAFQADIMNGVDPAPQDLTLQDSLFTRHEVKAFVYNEQVSDSITQSFLGLAKANGIPVVGVYETMPTPGYDYQAWMLAEVQALEKAVADRISTERL